MIKASLAAVPAALDQDRSKAFAGRMMRALNDAALVAMASLGHRLGLFDALDNSPPMTSETLAARANLQERYVREWLAVMVTAGVVEYKAQDKLYRLPAAHAAWLTRNAPVSNLAASAQFIPVVTSVETPLMQCFRQGGGLRYDQFARFHDVMADTSGKALKSLFTRILPLVDRLAEQLERGIRAVDIGCGQGRVLVALAERFPRSTFTGYDLCTEALDHGRREARVRNLANLSFEARDLGAKPIEKGCDLVTAFDVIHDLPDPQGMLDGIRASLAPGGVFLMVDIAGSSYLERNFDHPLAPFLYAVSTAHCTSVSLGQGGPGLGTMWGEELALSMLQKAGFRDVKRHRIENDIVNTYYVAR